MFLNPARLLPGAELPNRQATAPLLALVMAYLAANLALPGVVSGGANLYVAQPLLWLAVAIVCLRSGSKPAGSRWMITLGAGVGIAHVSCLAVAGVFFGFGRSPYARDALAISGNVLHLVTMLFALELARHQILSLLNERRVPGSTLLVALSFGLLSLPVTSLRLLADGSSDPVAIGGERIMPAISESTVATLLSASAGPYAALAYRLVLAAAQWTSPWLPDLTWLQAAVASVAETCIIGVALTTGRSEARVRRGVPAWMITTVLVATALIWLNTGLLGVQPALISGVSMEPTLRQGDVVIVRNVAPEGLRIGDVIRFDAGGVPIVHRVAAVTSGPGGIVFTTRGDNNDYVDAPVPAANVRGRVVATLPRVGLLPIAVRRLLGG